MKNLAIMIAVWAVSVGTALSAPPLRPALEHTDGLNRQALEQALASWESLHDRGEVQRPILSVIDYSLPSTEKRMWVFDLESGRLLFHEIVAHGRNSGENIAQAFSNDDGSYMTSLGAFITGESYAGVNGYSMRLRGTEPLVNDHAEARAIVMHGAPYVNAGLGAKQGRIGRSLGCPAVRPEVARALIDGIKGGSVLYAWHPSMSKAIAVNGR